MNYEDSYSSKSQELNHTLDRWVEAVRPRDFFSKVFFSKIENLRKFDSFYKKVGKRHKNHCFSVLPESLGEWRKCLFL